MEVYCCACDAEVSARLTAGREVYPHRPDLSGLHFWRCDQCGNHVGCHKGGTKPLGCIPTPEIRNARRQLHALIDPIWQSGRMSRSQIYAAISREIGRSYHSAEIRTIDEARTAYRAAKKYV